MEMRLGPSDAYVSEPVVQFVITLEAQAQNEEAHARLGALIPEFVVAACGQGRVPVAQNLRELAKLIPFGTTLRSPVIRTSSTAFRAARKWSRGVIAILLHAKSAMRVCRHGRVP
jgi:hypothetical protein